MKIRPLYNNILITPLEDKTTPQGIYEPDSVKDQQFKAIVVALGPGKYEDGEYLPHEVKVGDVILHKRWGVSTLKVDGKEHFIISEEDILGIIEESKNLDESKN